MTITGTFTVEMSPLDHSVKHEDGCILGRMALSKTFEGPLSGSSQGEMLTAMTALKGSAGYVAIEKFVGTLENKTGSFVLQHFGIMSAPGESRLVLEVVPDSGTNQLSGLSGKMEIDREDGKHSYTFHFEL